MAEQRTDMKKKPSTYWDQLGKRPKAFWDGVKEGINAYSIWKDGEQFVGLEREPQAALFAELDRIEVKKSPIAEAARTFLEELESPVPADKDEIDRLVRFIESNALRIFNDNAEALFVGDLSNG